MTLVVRGEAVCPQCIPAGATMEEIAADRRVSLPSTPSAVKDAARAAVCKRSLLELALIRDRVEFLIRRLDALAESREQVSQDLAAIGVGVAVSPDSGRRLELVGFRYGPMSPTKGGG